MAASGESIAELARKSLGVKYVWGGNSLTSGIDCSGLVQQVYQRFGIEMPRVTYDQINVGQSVQPNKLRPGDLVFFDTDKKRSGPDHVGIYLGGGKFIHAPRPGANVKISSLSEGYYMDRWMAGRRIPGVSADAASGGGEALEVAPRLDANELAETYGMSYAFFKSQPELWKQLNAAVEGQWTPDKFQAEVRNTKWWKTNSSSVRQAQVAEKTDPATYKANLAAAKAVAQQVAVKSGAIMSDKNLSNLARNMIYYNWNPEQVQNYVGQYIKFTTTHTLGGIAGQAASEIKKQAYSLGVSVSEQSVLNNAAYITRGISTMEKTASALRDQSAGLFPAFAEQIKAGASMQDLAQPYVQVLAGELRLPETDVNVFSPKIKAALNRVGPDGKPSPMDLTEFTKFVRDDPLWRRTPQAVDSAMGVGRQVLADMGLGG